LVPTTLAVMRTLTPSTVSGFSAQILAHASTFAWSMLSISGTETAAESPIEEMCTNA